MYHRVFHLDTRVFCFVLLYFVNFCLMWLLLYRLLLFIALGMLLMNSSSRYIQFTFLSVHNCIVSSRKKERKKLFTSFYICTVSLVLVC